MEEAGGKVLEYLYLLLAGHIYFADAIKLVMGKT